MALVFLPSALTTALWSLGRENVLNTLHIVIGRFFNPIITSINNIRNREASEMAAGMLGFYSILCYLTGSPLCAAVGG